MEANPLAMLFQQGAAVGFRAVAALPERGVAQHLPDRHAGRLQAAEEVDPDQDGGVIVPLARAVPVGIGQEPDPLVVADRVG